jgi:signal transduction histidine kinase
MIVRIQGEGQWELSGAQLDELDAIDNQMLEEIDHHDDSRFQQLLDQMLDYVRTNGRRLAPEEIVESNLILPPADATVDEVKALFTDEGLISSV